jgi:hypothetical protein
MLTKLVRVWSANYLVVPSVFLGLAFYIATDIHAGSASTHWLVPPIILLLDYT